jgi:hypothetical protein
MSEHRHGRRVRVVTDEEKYRRHRRKKMLRRLARVSVWVLLAAVGVVLFWLLLERMIQPSPH